MRHMSRNTPSYAALFEFSNNQSNIGGQIGGPNRCAAKPALNKNFAIRIQLNKIRNVRNVELGTLNHKSDR